jgi:hypothetical protein
MNYKEKFELKLSDVVYLQSIPTKNHFLMQVSFSLRSKGQYHVEVGLLNPQDELHRHIEY